MAPDKSKIVVDQRVYVFGLSGVCELNFNVILVFLIVLELAEGGVYIVG